MTCATKHYTWGLACCPFVSQLLSALACLFTLRPRPAPQFDINWESLGEALDRFSQFFIEPLISQDGIEREVRGAGGGVVCLCVCFGAGVCVGWVTYMIN